jgi:long-chain fatty acid transport protein
MPQDGRRYDVNENKPPGFACSGAASMRIYGVRSIVCTHESVMINRPGIFRFLALMISGALAWKASANGFLLPDQDAFATARGAAFVATADNPSAIYYNPAGITQLEGNNVRVGLYALDYNISFKPPPSALNYGQTYNEQDNFAAIPRAFYTFSPTNLPLSFGLGVYAPFGGQTSWPQNTGFRAVALNGKLTYVTINPVVAWKILPSLSIAAGPMVNYVDMNLEQGLSKSASPPNFIQFTGNGWSAGYNLGVLWQPYEAISLGATFRSPAKVALDGQTESQLRPPSSQSSAQMDLTFPMSAVGGISYRPTPKWNIEFDVDYTDWSSFGSTSIHQVNPPAAVPHADIPLILDWQPSRMCELGATRYFDNGWQVSAGFVYNENSVPNANYTPLVADMDRYFFSAGTGYKGKHFNFDIAYQFGYGPTHTVTGSSPSTAGQIAGQTADGKYDFISHAVSVSVGWRF